MNIPPPSDLAANWMLDPCLVFLNQGSYGATPRQVMAARMRYLEAVEQDPIRYLMQDAWRNLDRSREKLGELVNAPSADLVHMRNVTEAVATIVSNITLEPGDEIVANTHEYPACLAILEREAAKAGATVVKPHLPFPVANDDELYEAIMGAVTSKTRYCLVSHVTSPSAMVLPVARIVAAMRERGIETIVDGAHAPGFCEVDIAAINPAFYTANCHKWLCSPRASGSLYVRPDLQEGFRPLALSVNTKKPRKDRSFLHTEFDYVGTQDSSASFCLADAIDTVPTFIDGDWLTVRADNHAKTLAARDLLCDAFGVDAPVPDALLGSMATIPLPHHEPVRGARIAARPTLYADAMQDRLVEIHKIQVPVWSMEVTPGSAPMRFVRISCQLYNSPAQYEYLAEAILAELEHEMTL